MKILIVDDSDLSRLLIKDILNQAGYSEVQTIGSVPEAQELLFHADQEEAGDVVDIILMDVARSGMEGIEAIRAIKNKEETKEIPIIVLTGKDEKTNLEKAFEAGAIDFISLPVNETELLARVRSILKLKEETDRCKAHEKELEALSSGLELLSRLDGLTGVANRRSFDEAFDNEWLRARRQQKPLALLMIDIDFFKDYNDTYGHLRGDQCLKDVAEAMASAIKRPGDLLARFGGEEFVVLLPETEELGAVNMAETIHQRVADLGLEHSSSSVSDFLTVSIGLAAMVPNLDSQPETLLAASDQALYEAKTAGRNRIVAASIT